MDAFTKLLPTQRVTHEPVFYLTMLGVAISALVEALEVPGAQPLQIAVFVLSALAARARVTPTAKLP